MSTYEGLVRRSQGKLRPFILTRSAFAGSQRHVAIWTGDNAAEWGHLKIIIPMCLSLSVGGLPFCGADVGGFFKYPDSELFVRWYQAAAYHPFMRAHSHIDTRRREPWTYDDTTTNRVRDALRQRYSLLPYWYTLFYLQERNAELVMRPLWTQYPSEKECFAIEDEYLLGTDLLVHPVVEQGAKQVNVYFPGERDIWYDVITHEKFTVNGNSVIPVDMDKVPVYQRGGSIIPRKERIRRSSTVMRDDPYTLVIALDASESASGYLYIDDEQSFDYKNGKFLFLKFTYKNGKLTSRYADKAANFETKSWLEKVVIIRFKKAVTAAELTITGQAKEKLQVKYSPETEVLVIRKPGVNMAKEFEIELV